MGGVVSQIGQNMGNSRFGPPQQGGGGKGGPIAQAANAASQQPTQQPTSIEGLYQNVLGRAPDQGGADYWKQQFGDTVDANEYQTFLNAAKPEMQQRGLNGTVTMPGQGGQPKIGSQNPYSNTLGGWDNTQIRPVGQQGKGKGG